MLIIEDCILGNNALHERFIATTEILAKIVASAPRCVSAKQLENESGRSLKRIRKVCAGLEGAGLLRRSADGEDRWILTCNPESVTLDDVFRCLLVMEPRARPSKQGRASQAREDLKLFIMQATLTINQSISGHLRQFSLDRLKIVNAGMFSSPRRSLHNVNLGDTLDSAIHGQTAHVVLSQSGFQSG